jgi:hypothetical protein|tara:strand:- start:412 stop:768 length:357 start_codon:yes stop_codon:yes gene_type:complete
MNKEYPKWNWIPRNWNKKYKNIQVWEANNLELDYYFSLEKNVSPNDRIKQLEELIVDFKKCFKILIRYEAGQYDCDKDDDYYKRQTLSSRLENIIFNAELCIKQSKDELKEEENGIQY